MTPTQTPPSISQVSFQAILLLSYHFSISGPDYSDSDYLGNSSLSETVGVVGGPRYPPVGTTSKRSLNDRVRDYTGVRQDERLEHPAGSSSSRSSDSRYTLIIPLIDRHFYRVQCPKNGFAVC